MSFINKNIKIEYWTYPEGNDFAEIDNFVNNINQDYFLEIDKKRTDASGGGLYELVIEISENLSIVDLVASYIEDGIKLYIGYNIKEFYSNLKILFSKNKSLKPSVEQITINFKDCKVIFYETYENAIEENFESVINELIEFAAKKKHLFKKITKVYVPIFKYNDIYNLCEYRVKLNVDENINEFHKKDFLNFWGIKRRNRDRVYDVQKKNVKKKTFHTQKSYNKLFNQSRKSDI